MFVPHNPQIDLKCSLHKTSFLPDNSWFSNLPEYISCEVITIIIIIIFFFFFHRLGPLTSGIIGLERFLGLPRSRKWCVEYFSVKICLEYVMDYW
jgi:hypothetical protein